MCTVNLVDGRDDGKAIDMGDSQDKINTDTEGMKTNSIGLYRIVLLPETDAEAFEQHMLTQVFPEARFFARTTVSLTHRLLKYRFRQYVWMINAQSVTEDAIAFTQSVSNVQDEIVRFGLCISLDTFVEIGEPVLA